MEQTSLSLADGKTFRGFAIGAIDLLEKNSELSKFVGEVVFNTSMYGYQEILTDPSYAGQILCFTNPHIGNVGCNKADFESTEMFATATVLRDYSKVVSNYRSEQSLDAFLKSQGKVGIVGIDTRELVLYIREHGAQMGAIGLDRVIKSDLLVDIAKAQGSMEGKDYVKHVTTKSIYTWQTLPWSQVLDQKKISDGYHSRPHCVVMDCGVKRNILSLLVQAGFRVTVVPATCSFEQIQALSPDSLFLSNGPGDPATLEYVETTVKSFLGRLPILGICLGHQILSRSLGAKTFKLKFGHRGGNHPVKDSTTGKIEITVQNHGFAVDQASISNSLTLSHTNLNDGTVEGVESKENKAFAVQYHPESSPGPHDSSYLFNRFFELVTNS
jgi:carbamoyl-phosphate synthase small subunit